MDSEKMRTVKLCDIATLKYGKDHAHLGEGAYPVYGSGGVIRKVNNFLYDKPSVLIPRVGTLSNIFYSEDPFWVMNTIFYTEIDESQVLPLYLYYKLSMMNLASNNLGTAAPRLNSTFINGIELELPSLEEQQRIVDILHPLSKKIEVNDRVNSKYMEIAGALFKQMFFKEVITDGPSEQQFDGHTVPSTWNLKSLDEIAVYTNGLSMQKYKPETQTESLRVLKIRELRLGETDSQSELCSSNIKPDYIVNDGDVIFSWSASLIVDLWNGGKAGLNQHLFKVTSDEYPKWFYFMWTKYHLQKFIQIASEKATTMGHIKRSHLSSAKVLVPDAVTMQKMTEVFEPIISAINANASNNQVLKKTFQNLLPQLMSGKIFSRYPS